MLSRLLTVVLLSCLILVSTGAHALHITAGWTNSDVGLQTKGDGFYAGLQDVWPLGDSLFDFTASAEYVQKVGSEMRFYSDEQSGLNEGEATVRLHCVQSTAFMGFRLPVTSLKPRLYTGASVVLKLDESWDEPQGETDGEYNYENMDFQIHLGISLEYSRFLLDARYSTGLMDQLIDRTSNIASGNKAAEPDLPENGAKISSFQVGVGYSF